MNEFWSYFNKLAGRDRGLHLGEMEKQIFRAVVDPAANLEPHPYANCYQPSRCYPLMECSHPAVNLHQTNINFLGRI